MKTIPTTLPGHLIDWYWQEVENELVRTYRFTRESAKKGIRRIRRRFYRDGVGDIQYHSDVKQMAQGIKTGGYVH